jgi:hypothetical protein
MSELAWERRKLSVAKTETIHHGSEAWLACADELVPGLLFECPRGVEGCDGLDCVWRCYCGTVNCHEVFCCTCGGGDPRDE